MPPCFPFPLLSLHQQIGLLGLEPRTFDFATNPSFPGVSRIDDALTTEL